MVPFFSGPHGAEEERPDFWQSIPEGGDMLPGLMPGEPEESADRQTDGAGEAYQDALGMGEAPDALKRSGVLEELTDPAFHASHNDPLGSWTGVPELGDTELNEVPTQDQDDL